LNAGLEWDLELSNETWNNAFAQYAWFGSQSLYIGIPTPSIQAGGSGYVQDTYTNVPLTNLYNENEILRSMRGTGGMANVTVNSSGIVSSVAVTSLGNLGYNFGDTLGASNASLGGSGSGFQLHIDRDPGSMYCYRLSQIARNVHAIWASIAAVANLKIGLNGSLIDAGGGPSAASSRFGCSNLNTTTTPAYVGATYTGTNNNLYYNGDYLSYAMYYEGGCFDEQFGQFPVACVGALNAANDYDSGDATRMTRALNYVSWDLRQGVPDNSGQTIQDLVTSHFPAWNTTSTSNPTTNYPAGLPIREYEGALSSWYPYAVTIFTNGGCTTCTGIDPAVWSSSTNYSVGQTVTALTNGNTNSYIYSSVSGGVNNALPTPPASNANWNFVGNSYAQKMQNLVVAYRASTLAQADAAFMLAQWRSFSASKIPSQSEMVGGNPYALIQNNLYQTPVNGMYNAVEQYNNAIQASPFNFLLRRDLDGSNDNTPMWINRVA
jgi:hypothetical protein